jgi:transcriptional regulator with XRE-family HTH domain
MSNLSTAMIRYGNMQVQRRHQTVSEWETLVGDQIRRVRIAKDLDQAGLAELADISTGAVSNLERGKGSSLRTLIAVLRALGRTDWLESLAPAVSVSPMQLLRAKQRASRPRVRASRKRRPEPTS